MQSYLAMLTPTPRTPGFNTQHHYLGPIFQPPISGDLETFSAINNQFIKLLAPMALYDERVNGESGSIIQALRYVQRYLAPGGEDAFAGRMNNMRSNKTLRDAIYTFLIYNPSAPAATDPRPALQPKTFYAAHTVNGKEMGMVLARSGYSATDTYFSFRNDWNRIDHQRGDSLSFGLWKNGMWLTKCMTGYGDIQGCSDYRNALSLENGVPLSNQTPVSENVVAAHGGQWFYSHNEDPAFTARSLGDGFIYFTADATQLYTHRRYENLREVTHASRSIVWLKPDRLVIYDRAASKQAGYYKRFFINTPSVPVIAGNVAHAIASDDGVAKAGMFVTQLLPAGATMQVTDIASGQPAVGVDAEDMKARIFTEAPGHPQSAQFLHVVEGANVGANTATPAQVVASANGDFEGTLVGDTCVLFRKDLSGNSQSLSFNVPTGITRYYVTGLQPHTAYDTTVPGGAGTVSIQPGSQRFTDGGGVLILGNELPQVELTASDAQGSEAGGDTVSFTFKRSGDVSAALTVNIGISGDATAADFATLPATVTFAAASQTATLTLTPVDDAEFEGTESFTLTLLAGNGYHASEAAFEAVAQILDNDAPPGGAFAFTMANWSVAENAASLSVMVERTGGSTGSVSVKVSAANGTASASDYAAPAATLSWADGETGAKVFMFTPVDDNVYEGNETVTLSLSQYTGATGLGTPATATVTILENETPPPGNFTLTPVNPTVNEGVGTVTFTITRTSGTGGAVSVNYATVNGSATAGTDYAAKSGTLNWADGDGASKSVAVTVYDDSLYEGASEAFTFTLSNPAGGASISGASSSTVTITDNDPEPTEFNVGPGQDYATLGDVPWQAVGAGSVVYIHYQATPYSHKLLLSNRGTAEQPIRIVGLPGPEGERPVIDGANALPPTSVAYEAYTDTEDRSLIAVARSNSQPSSFKPGYYLISGLELRNAHPDHSYTVQNPNGGPTTDTWSSYASGIYLTGAEHVTIRDCVIHDCGQGIETSLGGGSEASLVRDLVIERCHIYHNGKAGQYYGQGVILQAVGVLFQFNRVEAPASGSNVYNVEDHSAGFVARGNWIEGGASQMQLADPSNTAPLITNDPSFGTVHVWGNLFRSFDGNSGNVVLFGGTVLPGRNLHFHHNTVLAQNGYSRAAVYTYSADESVVAFNNVYRHTVTEFRVLAGMGTGTFGKNVASPGFTDDNANASGTANIVSLANPGFVDEANGDYHPANGSALLDAAAPLPNGAQPPTVQYYAHDRGVLRYTLGGTDDIGAFEAAQPIDAWRVEKFGYDSADIAIAGDTANPDGDDLDNLWEYVLGGMPLATDGAGIKPVFTIENGYLTATVTRQPTATGVTITAFVCDDLMTWLSGPSATTTLANTAAQFKARDNVTATAPHRFMRLKLSRP